MFLDGKTQNSKMMILPKLISDFKHSPNKNSKELWVFWFWAFSGSFVSLVLAKMVRGTLVPVYISIQTGLSSTLSSLRIFRSWDCGITSPFSVLLCV